jgi:hypothetical protein
LVTFGWEAENFGGSRGKAAEGRRTPRRWREGYGSCVREASWSAPVLWRFGRVQICHFVLIASQLVQANSLFPPTAFPPLTLAHLFMAIVHS